MTSAAIYVRVSSKKQAAEEKTSLADQEKFCRAYAEREGWPVAGAFVDTLTGYETADLRPALREVRDLIHSSGATILLCWRFDRIARDQVDLMVLNREANQAGARLVSATEGPVEDNAASRGLLAIRGMAAEIEREGIVARTQGAIRTRAESGKLLIGGAPKYGLMYVGQRKDSYAINPETGPIVQRMYQMADEGRSLHDITRTLNDEGIPSPSKYLADSGGPIGGRAVSVGWRRQGVYTLLKDPAYMGKQVKYKRKRVKGQTTMAFRPEGDEKIIIQDIPAIVTPEQWQRVQTALAGHALARSNAVLDDMPLLSQGIAYCGHCGARCVAVKRNQRGGYRTYRCPNRKGQTDGGRAVCPGGGYAVKSEPVDDAVWAMVSEMASNTEQFREMILAPLAQAQARIGQLDRQEALLASELADAQKERDTLVRRIGAEDDDQIAATYRVRLKEVLSLIAGLESRQDSKDQQLAKLHAYLDVIAAAMSVDDGQGEWTLYYPETDTHVTIPQPPITIQPRTYTREQKRTLLRAIGARVLMYAAKSEEARTLGRQWDLQIVPPVSSGTHPGSDVQPCRRAAP